MLVQIQQLAKNYGATKAVKDVTFSFASGQIYGFIGPNGAGKSTTMRVLSALEEPTSGDCFIDGVSVTQYPDKTHKLVGYVPDNLPDHRDISIHEYLDFFARSYGVTGYRRKRVVEEIEEFCNLMGIREKHLNALSKGMKNRVSVARALVHDPPVLIMDEPASGLDPRARIELRELVKVLAGQGKAILISSHILTELGEIINGAVFIERGKVLRSGSMRDLQKETVPHRTVRITPLERLDELHKQLLLLPNVENVRPDEHSIEVDIITDEDGLCKLLADLIGLGFRIIEFKPRRMDLEQIFMNVTRGEVQ